LSDDRQLDGFFATCRLESLSAPGALPLRAFGASSAGGLRRSIVGIAERMTILPAYRERPVQALSGGNAQKVSIGKWLSGNPRILTLEDRRAVSMWAPAPKYTGCSARWPMRDLRCCLPAPTSSRFWLRPERVLVFHDKPAACTKPVPDISPRPRLPNGSHHADLTFE